MTLFLSRTDIEAVLDMSEVIAAVEQAHAALATGDWIVTQFADGRAVSRVESARVTAEEPDNGLSRPVARTPHGVTSPPGNGTS